MRGSRSGPIVGLLVISAFSNAAEQIGGLRGLPPGRLEEMLTGYGMLLVLGLGGAGLAAGGARLVASRGLRRRAHADEPAGDVDRPRIDEPRALSARGLSKSFGSLVALDDLDLDGRARARCTR